MIKLLAALFMLIDHIGAILFPQSVGFRIIGRISMPLFAYCVARGFYYSERKGTTGRYAKNLAIFSVVSQLPYAIWHQGALPLNIGFTWLMAVGVLKATVEMAEGLCGCYGAEKSTPATAGGRKFFFIAAWILVITVMTGVAAFGPIEYGLSGVLYPSLFYLFLFRWNRPQYVFLGMTALYAIYGLMEGSVMQVFSLAAWPVLLIARRYDDKIGLPRRFFYWFYPAHISALLILRGVFMS